MVTATKRALERQKEAKKSGPSSHWLVSLAPAGGRCSELQLGRVSCRPRFLRVLEQNFLRLAIISG